ncbi:Putative Fork head domain, winged helix-like DNA-binding domain superfamily [Colletotrichum destructivum]|uniref:Fork head domain, winged helix-like DNA-binding domain superfamily n=1 Tax=Colletotrichum destructivum TaxID=34406 RepID=A0AAX4J4H6_9PEZI|nr:Putative Fork head domain, winged helix-like DNA-binding domain superfamily [Colletotrichum destructivum]
MNTMPCVSPTSSSTEGFANDRSDSNKYYSNYGQGAYTTCSPSLVNWSPCRPASIQTIVPAVAAQHHLFFHPQEQPSVSGNLKTPMHISPDELVTRSMDGQGHYDNSVFQHSFWLNRWDSGSLQCSTTMERPIQDEFKAIDASVFQHRSSPVSFMEGSMVGPNVIPELSVVPELGQHTLSATGSPLQEEDKRRKPYSALIHEALKQADDHTMTLRELYKWFRDHTDKIKGEGDTGWQNSIRHNLSMNKVSNFPKATCILFRCYCDPPAKPIWKTARHTSIFASITHYLINAFKKVEAGLSKWTLDPNYINKIQPTTQFRSGNQTGSQKGPSRLRNAHNGGSGRRKGTSLEDTTSHRKRNRHAPSTSG